MRLTYSFILTALILVIPVESQNAKAGAATRKGTKWDAMDLGPFFSYGLEIQKSGKTQQVALKGISIKLDGTNAGVCFDTERMRLAAGWSGGFITLPTAREGLEGTPQIQGEVAFASSLLPGWVGPTNQWTEPIPPKISGKEVVSFGPLPKPWAKWRGIYLHGKSVILSYTVGESQVHESHDYLSKQGVFIRHIEIDRITERAPMTMLVCEIPGAKRLPGYPPTLLAVQHGDETTVVAMVGVDGKLSLTESGTVLAMFPDSANPTVCSIAIWKGANDKLAEALKTFQSIAAPKAKLSKNLNGGTANWPEPVITAGRLGPDTAPYVVDTITLPEPNPWRSWVRCSGFDFFKDGTSAAMCSVNGDVWIVSGIDAALKQLRWRRFAVGLFQPLGLKIVDEKVYVLGRDQITRLHDLNKDGEADFYENFNNDISISNHYHEYSLSLETDSSGNFHFIKGGNLGKATIPHHGCMLRVSKDGSKLDVVATGFRAPNGMSIGPAGEITSSDNEGNWVPSSRVNLMKSGGFYGHIHTAHREPPPTDYDKPLFWLPHQADNSSGGQVWVTSDKWGPFSGDMLHLSYGKCRLFKVLKEEVDGQWQGGAVSFPLAFDSGMMRGRFNSYDGQLYLCGLRVWQSSGAREGAFQRVRFTGKPVHLPKELHVRKTGIEITFTTALDAATASDDDSYSIDQWNYQWTQTYGSKMYSVKDPTKVVGEKAQGNYGGDVIAIKSVKLSEDKRTVLLEIPALQPAMQSRIRYNLKAADGTTFSHELFHTIHKVPLN